MKTIVVTFLLAASLQAGDKACALAHEMERPKLPVDVAVKYDGQLKDATTAAMNFWAARLGVSWHPVKGMDDCHIYVQGSLVEQGPNVRGLASRELGFARIPGDPKYDGIAKVVIRGQYVSAGNLAGVVAHEIGHLIGCQHGLGIMGAVQTDDSLTINDYALTYASAVRFSAAKQIASR